MRTCVRVCESLRLRRSCTPISTRSTHRSSSVTIRRCAASRSWSAAVSCWQRATRPRRSVCERRCQAGPHGGCARTSSTWRPGSRRTRQRAGRCSRSSATPRRSSNPCRSTRRSSTWPGSGGSPAHQPRSPHDCEPGSPTRSVCRSRSGSPGRSSWRRWRAGSPSPTVCSWSNPTASWPSSIHSRCNDCGASARSPRRSSTTGASTPWPTLPP